jgi:chaperone modulatory protein CbpM
MRDDRIEAELVSGEPRFELHELSIRLGVEDALVIEMAAHGVLEPSGSGPAEWSFSLLDVVRSQKALRLREDLGIDWPGLALALDLLDEVERLRAALAQRAESERTADDVDV